MFQSSIADLQEDTVVHMQLMVLSLCESSWWPVSTQREWELANICRYVCCGREPSDDGRIR